VLHYRIGNKSLSIKEYLSKPAILKRNLDKCTFRIGDVIRFKKPKKSPVRGTIVDIITDESKVVWARGTCPMNIVVELDGDKRPPAVVKTNIKKIVLVRMAK
jgi:hypothetical protein